MESDMLNHPDVFDPCRKCGAMAWVRGPDVDRNTSASQADDDVIERWNCPCGNFLTWGHPKTMESR